MGSVWVGFLRVFIFFVEQLIKFYLEGLRYDWNWLNVKMSDFEAHFEHRAVKVLRIYLQNSSDERPFNLKSCQITALLDAFRTPQKSCRDYTGIFIIHQNENENVSKPKKHVQRRVCAGLLTCL